MATQLCESWVAFAPKNLKDEYLKLQNPNDWDLKTDREGFLDRGLEIFTKIAGYRNQKNRIESRLKSTIESGLIDGDLIAFGYLTVPSRGNGPVEIDISDSLKIDIDWQSNELSTHERTYDRVCVIPKNELQSLICREPSKPVSNAIEKIRNAIFKLLEMDGGFEKLTRKQQAEKVRKYLKIDHVTFDGYSDNNIKKHLLSLCGPKRK